MKKTYEFKNNKYNIVGYTLTSEKESKKYKTDVTFGNEDNVKWILKINEKDIAFYNTGSNIVCDEHVIIENDELNIVTDFDYYKIDLKSLKCMIHIDLTDYMSSVTCNLIKYNKGFLILCDLELICIEDNKVKWVYDSYNGSGFKNIEILKSNIIKIDVLDAYGLAMYTVYLDNEGKNISKNKISSF